MVAKSIDHEFWKAEKPRFVSLILQIKPYMLYMLKLWVSPTLKIIFTPFPFKNQLFYFWFDSITWDAITN